MDIIEQRTHTKPRAKAYSSSETPPLLAPRKDSRSLGLRRYNSSNVDNKSQVRGSTKQPYESEYEKVNRLLRHSLNAESRSLGRNGKPNTTLEPHSPVRPRSHTKLLVEPVHLNDDIYLSDYEIASLPQTNVNRDIAAVQTRSLSPLLTGNQSQLNFTPDTLPHSQYSSQPQKKHDLLAETAIYGVAQGKGVNLVMELKQLQKTANILYKEILNTKTNSPEMADLRKHLRCGDEASTSDVLEHIHATLQPPKPDLCQEDEENEIYLIDFKNCFDKIQLREKIMQLFTTPGPPSIAYQKITAKLDSLIYTFVETVVKMRVVKNETIKSPYHVQCVLQETGHESDQFVKTLQNNELWIRWGTETGLPPLHHIYMLKYPPSYGMRKSIVMSMLAEKSSALKKMYSPHTRPESLIPPIYSKLESEEDGWQVTEFDPETQKFESRETTFPSWVDECGKLATHLQSAHRTKFKLGDHIYALYSVYMIVIKDITLTEADYPKESRVPSSHQIYIGSSSTGVLYRFLNVEKSHCDNMTNVLEESSTKESYRCQHDYELVEACLVMAWVRRQPRAVFVINSFQQGDMENMSLNKKKPFHDKMISLKQHYMESKKIGPANDMRYGMNQLGDRCTQ